MYGVIMKRRRNAITAKTAAEQHAASTRSLKKKPLFPGVTLSRGVMLFG